MLHQPWEERVVFQVNEALLQVFFRNLKEFHGHQAEPLLLESLDDLSHQATLHTIWLDRNEDSRLVMVGKPVGQLVSSMSIGSKEQQCSY